MQRPAMDKGKPVAGSDPVLEAWPLCGTDGAILRAFQLTLGAQLRIWLVAWR